MKFKEIRAVYIDGMFDSFLDTTLDNAMDYLKENGMIDELIYFQLFIK